MKRLLILALLCVSQTAGLRAQETTRPNFLFIVTDDQRWDAIGAVQKEQGAAARFPWLNTPALDRLKSESATFRNAFCTTSLCSPGRASLLTGQYAHRHTVVNNHTPLPVNAVTYASVLKEHGYSTGYIGKWHMGQQNERPGFDFFASFNGQGTFFNCPILVHKNGETQKVIAKKWVDDQSADYAVDFLREHKNTPFLLTVGFKSVHGPREPSPDLAALYTGEIVRPTPNTALSAPFRKTDEKNAAVANPGNPNLLNYFRTLTSVDRSLGRILDELKSLGLEQNTIVIFTSDNGYYLGEHGLGDKRSAYEESLRIPLLIRSPFHKPANPDQNPIVLNIDLAPTIVDLAGIPVPPSFEGRSLKPLLENNAPPDWRDSFLYSYFYERGFRNPTIIALRTATAKLITYPGREEWTEMYALDNDSYETENLHLSAAHQELRKSLEAELEAQKSALQFSTPQTADPDQFGFEVPKAKKKKKSAPKTAP